MVAWALPISTLLSTLFLLLLLLLAFYYYYATCIVFFSSLPFLSVIGLDCDYYAGAGIIRQVGEGVLEHERLLLFFLFPTYFFHHCYSLLVGKKKIVYDRISCHGLLGSWSAPMGVGR